MQARHRFLPLVLACLVADASSVASADPAATAPTPAPAPAPTTATPTPSAPELTPGLPAEPDAALLARSRELYATAESAMAAGRFADAARDYALAYDGMKDPVLFYKIGVANKQANQCDTAVVYLQRYLREGHPNAEFRGLTEEHIVACGGQLATAPTAPPAAASPPPMPLASAQKPTSKRLVWAWTATGTSVATASLGAVMLLSSHATGEEIDDLIEISGGSAADLTPTEKARKSELEDERNTFRTVAWISFGVAGAAAVTATVLFLRDDPPPTRRLEVAPLWTPGGGGITVLGRF